MMPKGDTIAAIVRLNRTVNPAFLAEFSNEELFKYLKRLDGVASSGDHLEDQDNPADPAITDEASSHPVQSAS